MREVWGLSKRAWRDIHVRLAGHRDINGISWNIEMRGGEGGKGVIGEGGDYSACVGVVAVGKYLGPRQQLSGTGCGLAAAVRFGDVMS
jgi:hypothetical protein